MEKPSSSSIKKNLEARRLVEIHCQLLVNAGEAHWQVNSRGETELHLISGEKFIFGPNGIRRVF
ncbi:hypothetical protein NS2R_04680 [Pseudomonas oryzihabitans]|nr:hypothetical protein NS2R_04680 [Pseudomonas psychrotolerans]